MAVVQSPFSSYEITGAECGAKVYYCDSAGPPTAGTYNVGDLAIAMPVTGGVAPTSATPFGWRCTTAGTPGTWTVIGGASSSAGTSAVASATTVTITSRVTHISGTATINTITYTGTVPGAEIAFIPDGAFVTGTSGNIGHASTGVVNVVMLLVFDGTKWYPSY